MIFNFGTTFYNPEKNTRMVITDEYGYSGEYIQNVLFEELIGPIPSGFTIYFADNDPFHVDIDNLVLVKTKSNVRTLKNRCKKPIYSLENIGSKGNNLFLYTYKLHGNYLYKKSNILENIKKHCLQSGLIWAYSSNVHPVSEYKKLL